MILAKNDQVIVYSTDDEERSGANQLAISLIAPVTKLPADHRYLPVSRPHNLPTSKKCFFNSPNLVSLWKGKSVAMDSCSIAVLVFHQLDLNYENNRHRQKLCRPHRGAEKRKALLPCRFPKAGNRRA